MKAHNHLSVILCVLLSLITIINASPEKEEFAKEITEEELEKEIRELEKFAVSEKRCAELEAKLEVEREIELLLPVDSMHNPGLRELKKRHSHVLTELTALMDPKLEALQKRFAYKPFGSSSTVQFPFMELELLHLLYGVKNMQAKHSETLRMIEKADSSMKIGIHTLRTSSRRSMEITPEMLEEERMKFQTENYDSSSSTEDGDWEIVEKLEGKKPLIIEQEELQEQMKTTIQSLQRTDSEKAELLRQFRSTQDDSILEGGRYLLMLALTHSDWFEQIVEADKHLEVLELVKCENSPSFKEYSACQESRMKNQEVPALLEICRPKKSEKESLLRQYRENKEELAEEVREKELELVNELKKRAMEKGWLTVQA